MSKKKIITIAIFKIQYVKILKPALFSFTVDNRKNCP